MILLLLLKTALLLIFLFALPIAAIRAQPYVDRVTPALIHAGCPTPCLMDIRPGFTRMGKGIALLNTNAWVVADSLPTTLREAIFQDAAVPRIDLDWRWSAEKPDWINAAQNGSLTLEGREVRGMTIATHFTLGEIMLAFGTPDETRFAILNNNQYRYTAWYARQGMLIMTRGTCPTHSYYRLPVQILYRPDYPRLAEAAHRRAVCG